MTPPDDAPPQELGGLDPGELLARGLNTVQPSASGAAWTPPTPEELARLLPQYRIERLIGHGGMGAVYQGEQPALDRRVAIKLLPAEMTGDAQFVARFQREARTLAKLQHPGIVAVYDFGQTTAGHPYFVMEYVDGTDLHRLLRSSRLEPGQAFELIAQICDALYYAHRQGVIHRDIKPANILINMDGRAKVADFGLARPIEEKEKGLTETNMVMGTPDYMAPEQRAGQGDHRADIFALGVMLYEMLTGQTPRGAFEPPSRKVRVDVRIDQVVLKALQAEPARRYQQVSEMRTDVERIRTTPLPARPKVVVNPPGESRRALLGWSAAFLTLLGVGTFFVWHRGSHSSKASLAPKPHVTPAMSAARPPATPFPITTSPTDAVALEAALLGNSWSYSSHGKDGKRTEYELHFEKNHVVRVNRGTGVTWFWWTTGPRTIHVQLAPEGGSFDARKGMNLTFDAAFTSYDGTSPDNARRQHGTRLAPKVVASTRPSTPTPAPVATPRPASTPQSAIAPADPRPSDTAKMKQIVDVNFARSSKGFPMLDEPLWHTAMVGGEYQMLCRGQGLFWVGQPLLQDLHINDFVCEIRASIVHAAPDDGWGLGVVRNNSTGPWTTIMVNGLGMVTSRSNDPLGPEMAFIAPRTRRPVSEASTLRIEAVGARFRVFMNGEFLFERQHERLRPDSALTIFCAGGTPPIDIRLQAISVWVPATGSTTPAAAVATTTPPPLSPSTNAPLPAVPPAGMGQFVNLFDAENAREWKHIGGGGLRANGEVRTAWAPTQKGSSGLSWYAKRAFSDFVLRLEYLAESSTSNSGVFMRFSLLNNEPNVTSGGYEVQIHGSGGEDEPTGSIYRMQRPTSAPVRPGWNELEIMAVKQNYTVTVNGVVTNRFTGSRALAGYIALQSHRAGPVQFRNVRICDLTAANLPPATSLASLSKSTTPTPVPVTLAPVSAPPSAMKLPSMAEVAKQHEDDVFVHGKGPSGTNFGGGVHKMKLSVSLDTKSTQPRQFTVSCFWIGWDGKHHKVQPIRPENTRMVTVSASSPQSIELEDRETWGRTDGGTKGVIAETGVFRGWVVSVRDREGKKVAGCANLPEFTKLAP